MLFIDVRMLTTCGWCVFTLIGHASVVVMTGVAAEAARCNQRLLKSAKLADSASTKAQTLLVSICYGFVVQSDTG